MPEHGRTRPQSMLFTLFGDYIRRRGDEIWVGSLIKIAGQFGLSQRAVRSALSRMSQNGWLRVRRVANRSYYAPTARTTKLLEEGERRIFTRRTAPWTGEWRLVVYSIPEQKRVVRTELRKQLSWLGFGPLGSGSWICPHDLEAEVQSLMASLKIETYVERFAAIHHGSSTDRDLAARCWDLAGINRRYREFLAKWEPSLRELQDSAAVSESDCFVQRFWLIHEYRKFFFDDPELPNELLPEGWCGNRASELFHTLHNSLADRANAYFDSVFEAPDLKSSPGGPKRQATRGG